MFKAPNYQRWLAAAAIPHLGQRVLEIGAGLGYMTERIADGRVVTALDIRSGHVDVLRARFAGWPSVEPLEGDITDPELMRRMADRRFDSAVSFNVFEHIEDDVRAFENVYRLLLPGSRFVCLVPAFRALYGPHDAAIGHVRRYSRRELRRKATAAGFDVVDLRLINSIGFFAWFLNGTVFRSSGFAGGERLLGLYDRLVIPMTSFREKHWRPPFGQSLLLVGQRRA